MNFFERVKLALGLKYDSLDLLREVYGSRATKSGATVNWETSLQVTTVLACVRVIAEGIAQVPFRLMVEKGDVKAPATEHPLYDLIYRKPNRWQSSYEFRETLALHLVLLGNAYVLKLRVGIKREIRELVLLEPNKVTPRVVENDVIEYVWRSGAKEVVFKQDAIWHIRGPSWNSYIGMEPVKLAQEAIGLAMSMEGAHASLHKNGAKVSGVYSVDGTLSTAKYEVLLKYLKDRSTAGDIEGAPLILDQGAKWTQQTLSGADAQHLETRKHQIEEICSAFRVFPIMIGHADKTQGFSSTEQMFIAHVVHSLMPWYVRIEQSAELALLSEEDRKSGHYVKFFPNGLMRGNAKDRSDFYKNAIGSVNATPGWMTINEVRKLEDLPPDPEGEKLFIPQATATTAPAGDTTAKDQPK